MKAPETIPYSMFEEYTMGGLIDIKYSYRNDCSAEIQNEINQNFTKEKLEEFIQKVRRKEVNYYGHTDAWMYEALEKYPIQGKSVCIVGSTCPWYEAMAIEYGASRCVIFEYGNRETFDDRLEYLHPDQIGSTQFDVCFSVSSFEHDGLGRYGDPLNADGDLQAMQKAKQYVKKDGIMFLSVPTGRDCVYFNVHRVYGEYRFPELIKNWEVLDRFGFFPETFTNSVNTGNASPYQPVCVLRNS
jgi:hypothetical protein